MSRLAEAAAAAMQIIFDDRRRYANRVLNRLERKPRYQSIGRKQYVYVEDVQEALEREMGDELP